jgi:hypothetical protein
MRELIYQLLIIVILCFDYYWIAGVIPFWLICTFLAFLIGNFGKKQHFFSKKVLNETSGIMLTWLVFSIYVFIRKMIDSSGFEAQYSLNFLVISSVAVFFQIGYKIKTKTLMYVVGGSILLHGIFVVGQILGQPWAWDFASKLMASKEIITKTTSGNFNEGYYENAFDAYGRVKGTHVHIHVFSSIIGSLALFFFLAVSKKVVSFRKRRVSVVMFLIALIGLLSIFLTFTRAIIIPATLILFLYFFHPKNISKNIPLLFVIIFISFIGTTYVTQSIEFKSANRLLNFGSEDNRADEVRFTTYATSFNAIDDAPFFGGGIYDYHTTPHNIFLNITVKFGFVGLFFYLLALWSLILFLLKRILMKRSKKHKTLIYLLGVVVFMNLFNAMFHTNTYLNKSIYQPIFTALIIGQILREEHQLREIENGSNMPST